MLQLSVSQDTSTTEDAYMQVIVAKTAALFAAAAEVGAVVASRPREEQAALESYGRNLGIAFQLIDDALDYSGSTEKLGKGVGDDFRERKITLAGGAVLSGAGRRKNAISGSARWKTASRRTTISAMPRS